MPGVSLGQSPQGQGATERLSCVLSLLSLQEVRRFGKSSDNLGPITYFFPLLSTVNLEVKRNEIEFLICGFGNLDFTTYYLLLILLFSFFKERSLYNTNFCF